MFIKIFVQLDLGYRRPYNLLKSHSTDGNEAAKDCEFSSSSEGPQKHVPVVSLQHCGLQVVM